MPVTPQVGDTVWVWHFETLRQIKVESVFEMSGVAHVTYPGFATEHFFYTRNAAIEHRVKVLCGIIGRLSDYGTVRAVELLELKSVAKQTLSALTENPNNDSDPEKPGSPKDNREPISGTE